VPKVGRARKPSGSPGRPVIQVLPIFFGQYRETIVVLELVRPDGSVAEAPSLLERQ
jgi:hypothetical protein